MWNVCVWRGRLSLEEIEVPLQIVLGDVVDRPLRGRLPRQVLPRLLLLRVQRMRRVHVRGAPVSDEGHVAAARRRRGLVERRGREAHATRRREAGVRGLRVVVVVRRCGGRGGAGCAV